MSYEAAKEFLSPRTIASMLKSDWLSGLYNCGATADVYVCEAFGGVVEAELVLLFNHISANGSSVILVWTGDYPFPAIPDANVLTFEVAGKSPFCAGYFWDVSRYGPSLIKNWMNFADRPILASFVGSRRTHSCREPLFASEFCERADIIVRDIDWWSTFKEEPEIGHERRIALKADYSDILARSKFALCPRGNGPSSIRRWEAVYSGAIPVLIDDTTQPWNISFPSMCLSTIGKTIGVAADELLSLLLQGQPRGEDMQLMLRELLLSELDVPQLSPNYTAATRMLSAANTYWSPGCGFTSQSTKSLRDLVTH